MTAWAGRVREGRGLAEGAGPGSGTAARNVGVASAPPGLSKFTAVTTWGGNAPKTPGAGPDPPLPHPPRPRPLPQAPPPSSSTTFAPSAGWDSRPRGLWALTGATTAAAAAAAAPPPPPSPLPVRLPATPLPLRGAPPLAPPLSGARSAREPSGSWRSCTSITSCTPGASSDHAHPTGHAHPGQAPPTAGHAPPLCLGVGSVGVGGAERGEGVMSSTGSDVDDEGGVACSVFSRGGVGVLGGMTSSA